MLEDVMRGAKKPVVGQSYPRQISLCWLQLRLTHPVIPSTLATRTAHVRSSDPTAKALRS